MGDPPFRLGAWVGTELFERRLASHECGCELARRADNSEDGDALRQMALAQQSSWQCPGGGHSGVTDDPSALAVLDAVATLCDVQRACLKTCPRWDATRPEITRAVTYRRYVEAGCPQAIEENPPVALIRAAHLVAAADGDRLTAERADQESKRGR